MGGNQTHTAAFALARAGAVKKKDMLDGALDGGVEELD